MAALIATTVMIPFGCATIPPASMGRYQGTPADFVEILPAF